MCDAVSCTNVQNDRNNCGHCGSVCPPGDACLMGGCTDAPPTHYLDSIPTAAEAPFVDACAAPGSAVILAGADDDSSLMPLPFAFRYWATDLPIGAMINVCSNGWLGMDGVQTNFLGGSIPDPGDPNSVIAPHWGDDHTSDMGICVATLGTAPNRQWVVEWDQSYYCCSPGPILTYEVILNENSGVIDFVYQTMMGARTQVSGLEDPTGTMGIGGCGTTTFDCLPATNTRVRFTPTP